MRIERNLIATRSGTVRDTPKHNTCQTVSVRLRFVRCPCSSNTSVTSVTSVTSYIRARIRSCFAGTESVTASDWIRDTRYGRAASGEGVEPSNGAMATAARSQAARHSGAARRLRCEAHGPHSAAGAALTPSLPNRLGSQVAHVHSRDALSKHIARSVTVTDVRARKVNPRLSRCSWRPTVSLRHCRAAFHVQPGEVRA